MTNEQVLREGEETLGQAGIEEAKLDAWYMFAAAYKEITEKDYDRVCHHLHAEEEITPQVSERFQNLLYKRKTGCPVAYILHETEFMGLPFYVDGRVLIPRQDTECLVEEALDYSEDADILDLCTGSGCIAISLAKLGSPRSVTATDKSAEALAVARENIRRNSVDVSVYQGDLWDAITSGGLSGMRYDLITCNPPYIRREVIPELMREVRDFEPVMALDGGLDGLDFYKRIIEGAELFLQKNGRIFLEIGYDQGAAVSEMMKEAGFSEVSVIKDLAGLDRVMTGRMKDDV